LIFAHRAPHDAAPDTGAWMRRRRED